MIRPIILTTLSALIAVAAAQATAGEAPKLVDCTLPEPQSIQDALAGVDPDPGETLIITVRGTCTEDVTIVSDDITLRGETPSDGISGGGITVRGAQRVVIDNLTVSGAPNHGVLADSGASVTVSDSTITNNSISGIAVRLGATAQINGNTISGNGEYAIVVVEEGSARLRSNTITTTYIPGAIGVFRNAALRLNGGNTVTNTNGAANAQAIEVFHVSNLRQDRVGDRGRDVFTANRVISVGKLSQVEFRDFEADGNAQVFNLSLLALRNGVFNGHIQATSPYTIVLKTTSVTGSNSCNGAVCFGF